MCCKAIISLGPHCAYFRMRKLKSQLAKVSTVRVEKIFALAVQHSYRNCKSHLSSLPNWLVVIEHFIESECDLKMNALFITHH